MSHPTRQRHGREGATGRDVVAGVSVALILIPQALAYAGIAGVPAHVGLLAAALPTIAAAPFASSRYLQTGPGAMTALLTFGALSTLATPFTAEYVGLAALLALVVGVIRVALGAFHLGWVSYFMSRPVIVGFTLGATTLIAASQLPGLVGVGPAGNDLIVNAWTALRSPSAWELDAVLFSIGTVLFISFGRRIGPRFPAVLIAVVAATFISTLTGYDGRMLGEIPSSFPALSLDLPWRWTWQLLVPGLVIALVGFTEAAAISTVFAAEDRERWDASREFISQGAANLASGLSGGFPVGGSFARSSINKLAGARTRWSGAVTGLVVLAFLPFANVLRNLPSSVLAAIVVSAVARLIKPRQIIDIWRRSRLQGGVAGVTLAATLVLSPRIDLAVIVGIALAVAVHLAREMRLDVEVVVADETLRIAPNGVIYFGSTPQLTDLLINELAEHPEVDRLIIDLSGVGRIDFTGGNALSNVITDAKAAGLDIEIVEVPPHARRIVKGVLRDLELG